ncbi:MAG: sugar phosphate nucleotidyltransferase [bacterium]|nr:sugar phosphate nucleotidyltransferase [bacterium]
MIAAAGKGTRAYPRTSFIPKPLFTFENQSILERNVDLMFKTIGVKKLFIIVGHLQELVLAEVDRIRLKYPDREIETAQWTQKGLGADVASLRGRFAGDFALVLGDEFYYNMNHEQLKRMWKAKPKADSLIAVLPSLFISHIRKNYSVILKGTRVIDLVEKPKDPPNNLLGLGSYVFSQRYFEYFDKTPPSDRSGVVELTETIDLMSRELEVHGVSLKGTYYNINSLADYYAANYLIRTDKFAKYKISLVVPALNNAATLPDVLSDFDQHVDEVIVVDMGSADGTQELAAKNRKAKVFRESTPQGFFGVHYAPAIYAAMKQCRGDIIVLAPADGSFRAVDLPKLLEYLKDSDMAVGTRTTRQMMEQGANLSPLYRWLNVFFGKLVEILWWGQEPRFTDIGCLYRAIWKDSFEKIAPELEAKNKTFSLEMMIEIMRYHMRCIEVPVSFYQRYGAIEEETIGQRWRYFFSVLRMIFQRRFLKR